MKSPSDIDAQIDRVLATESVGKAQALLRSRVGWWMLGAISFVESALPIPLLTDPFLVAAILLDRSRAIFLVVITTITSILGGLFAYTAGLLFTEVMLAWMTPGMVAEYQSLMTATDENAFMLTLLGAVTPLPFTFAAVVVGAIGGNPFAFIAASIIGRGARYAIVGYLTHRFGQQALFHARRYFWASTVLVILLAIAYVWYKM